MNDDINYKNNPLNGVGLKQLLNEIVDHYGFGILYAYLNINCFNANASIESSIKFLKKTKWAREKVEAFYMYEFKNLPKASASQFELAPRDRIVPDEDQVGEPAELSLGDAETRREETAEKAAAWDQEQRKRKNTKSHGGNRGGSYGEGRGGSQGYGSARPKPSRESNSPWPSSSPARSHTPRDNASSAGNGWPQTGSKPQDDSRSQDDSKPQDSGKPDPWGNFKK